MALFPQDENSKPISVLRISTTEEVDGTSASAQNTTAYDKDTVIRIVSDAAVNVAVGTNPTATGTTAFLPANVIEYLKMNDGDKIAVLGGVLNISIMT